MRENSSLIEHELVFTDLLQSLTAIGKTIDPDELIITAYTPIHIGGTVNLK